VGVVEGGRGEGGGGIREMGVVCGGETKGMSSARGKGEGREKGGKV